MDRPIDGVWRRIKLACAAFFTILFKGRLPADLTPTEAPVATAATAPTVPARPGRAAAEPVRAEAQPATAPEAQPSRTGAQPSATTEPPSRVEPPTPAPSHDAAVQLLALLQREGRLADFVREDLTPYSDTQIGAAARDVHAGCRRVLEQYVTLEPVVPGREGDAITVGQDRPIDPAALHLVGNVVGQPPFRGRLLHPGWRVTRIELPPLPASGRTVVAPAEVEIP